MGYGALAAELDNSWPSYLVHDNIVLGLPVIWRNTLDMRANDVVKESYGIFRRHIDVILVNEPIGVGFTVK